MLAYLRKCETFAGLAAGFGIGTATAWRYVTETVGLLAARSPRLRYFRRRCYGCRRSWRGVDALLGDPAFFAPFAP